MEGRIQNPKAEWNELIAGEQAGSCGQNEHQRAGYKRPGDCSWWYIDKAHKLSSQHGCPSERLPGQVLIDSNFAVSTMESRFDWLDALTDYIILYIDGHAKVVVHSD